MKIRKMVNTMIILLVICLLAGAGAFIYNAVNRYNISNSFTGIPLQFDPDDSSSVYQMQDSRIVVYGGFIKGIQSSNDGTGGIVVRALSPLPKINIEGSHSGNIQLLIENINPEFYARQITGNKLQTSKLKANTLQVNIPFTAGKIVKIEPLQPSDTEKEKYIILGDNRNGYDTFEKIIQQVNGEKPAFVIDNGDLVFSGKPNQYRLFDQMTAKISSTLCTTPGNHDIRGNGRITYSMLYGPTHYSFDYAGSHFAFLDSSPGWAEKKAISDEQYAWLERDLKKAQGKNIFVVTHIPPHDPRSGVTKNEIPNYVNQAKSGESWVEQKLDNYYENKDMEHGFQDSEEAARFEALMSTYHVNTVYLSHIHSYMEYTKDGVRYLISGGAGAELLTENSYYHYMISGFEDPKSVTMVELPSPANNYITRYGATIKLFSKAMYEENPIAVIFIVAGFVLFLILLLIKLYLWRSRPFNTLFRWLLDIVKYSVKRFKELFIKKK